MVQTPSQTNPPSTRHRVLEAAACQLVRNRKNLVQLGGTVVAMSIAAAPVTTAAPVNAIS